MTMSEKVVDYTKGLRIRLHIKRTALMFKMSKVPEVVYTPEKLRTWRKVRHFMRGRWKGFLGGGLLIGSAFATGGLSVGLQAVGGTILTAEGMQEIGRQTTKYGEKGTFGLSEILSLIIDLLSLIIAAFTKKENLI